MIKNMKKLSEIKKQLKKSADKNQAKILSKFFKTGPGQYGHGDIFWGIKVPRQRQLAKKYPDLSLAEIKNLLYSNIHEQRLTALFILIGQYEKAEEAQKKKIFDLYLKSCRYINNWDLVDLSAPNIVGQYLINKPRDILYRLAKSKNLWKNRIAILATYAFIKNNDFHDALAIIEINLNHQHDLIHKAAGWMLREIGKRNQNVEEQFLKKHRRQMPRTMLRYAIEKFPETKRQSYLKK